MIQAGQVVLFRFPRTDLQEGKMRPTLPDGTSVVYTYDADGRRIQQNIDSQITNYLWDETSPYGDVILETDGSGAALASYVLGGAELLSQTRDGTTSYYLPDGQGNIRALTDDSGYVTDTYAYSAFGEVLSRTGSTVNPYQYTSQQFDVLTGLYSLRARYYDPAIGRFLTRDIYPYNLSVPSELNTYFPPPVKQGLRKNGIFGLLAAIFAEISLASIWLLAS